MNRIRYKHSASVFVALMRGLEVCLLRRKNTGWMDGSFSLPAGGLDEGETIAFAARRAPRSKRGNRGADYASRSTVCSYGALSD
jgi:8-oxo-dGTP pyrophosphatase MutT (NUDIX family)